jgi:DDE superfamily endonuclease
MSSSAWLDDIVVMDNCRVHMAPAVSEAIEKAKASLRYLPKYSPDLNPIELPYSKFKTFLRKVAARTVPDLTRAIRSFIPQLRPSECANYFAHAGYGFKMNEIRFSSGKATIERQQAGFAQARLNLPYTQIRATETSSVANKTVGACNYVQPGQTLFSIAPDTFHITTNFKETQLSDVRPDQRAMIWVDVFPGLRLD